MNPQFANALVLGVGSDSEWRTLHLGDGQESRLGLIISCRDSILLASLERDMYLWVSGIKNCCMKWNLEIICDHSKLRFKNIE